MVLNLKLFGERLGFVGVLVRMIKHFWLNEIPPNVKKSQNIM